MSDHFRGGPLDGEFGPFGRSVLIVHHEPSQTKVGHFYHVSLADEAIAGRLCVCGERVSVKAYLHVVNECVCVCVCVSVMVS